MSQPHPLGVLVSSSQQAIESVDPQFVIAGLLQARQKTWSAVDALRSVIKAGMTEDDARKLALKVFLDLGVSKHWHKPYIRFGLGTTLTFHDPLQPDYRLQDGDPFYIDLGPVWKDPEHGLEYEGDCGDTFVLGENTDAESCAATARRLFTEAQREWKDQKTTGAGIYQFLKKRSSELGYTLVENVDGHRLSDFPHHQYTKECLGQIPFVPSASLWVLELQIIDAKAKFGAFFEDLL